MSGMTRDKCLLFFFFSRSERRAMHSLRSPCDPPVSQKPITSSSIWQLSIGIWNLVFGENLARTSNCDPSVSKQYKIRPQQMIRFFELRLQIECEQLVLCSARPGSRKPSKPSHGKPSFCRPSFRLWAAQGSGLSSMEPWAVASAAAFCG